LSSPDRLSQFEPHTVSTRDILAELPALAEEISRGTFDIDVRPTPLTDVEQTWADAAQVAP
jgi:hypothetical protein